MTLSLNTVSIKMKWQSQANKYNIPKQDMLSADFILFPPYGLVGW